MSSAKKRFWIKFVIVILILGGILGFTAWYQLFREVAIADTESERWVCAK